jgi:transcriptional regulator with XRE-family HTH domain
VAADAGSGTRKVTMRPSNPLPRTSADFARVLGQELQQRRQARGFTAGKLAALLPISPQAVRSYEQAARSIMVERLYEICAALGERPSAVLAVVEARMFGPPDKLPVNLAALAAAEHTALQPARVWARRRVAVLDGESSTILLSADAVFQLAALCEIDLGTLLTALETL